MPTTTFRKRLSGAIDTLAAYHQQRRLREAVADLDAHMLADIGLERDIHGNLRARR